MPVVGNGSSAVLADVGLIVLLVLFFESNSYSQIFNVGVKGGTVFSDSTSSVFVGTRAGSGLSTLSIRRYAIGPTFEVALPFGLRFEADALFKRLDRTEHRFFHPSFGNVTREAANAWEFPLLLKYPLLRRGRLLPFVAAGGTLRRIQSFDGSTETFAYGSDCDFLANKRPRFVKCATGLGLLS